MVFLSKWYLFRIDCYFNPYTKDVISMSPDILLCLFSIEADDSWLKGEAKIKWRYICECCVFKVKSLASYLTTCLNN